MPFKVTDKKWLETESARITSILLIPRFWHRAWTPNSLQEALSEIGLIYSLPQVTAINDELHKQGIVEDVKEPAPVPEPHPGAPY